jgi:hypothetical protein
MGGDLIGEDNVSKTERYGLFTLIEYLSLDRFSTSYHSNQKGSTFTKLKIRKMGLKSVGA